MTQSEWMLQQAQAELIESANVNSRLAQVCLVEVVHAAEVMVEAISQGAKILLCGNGGSAADAQHIASELVCRLKLNRSAWPAISLTTNTSILTAWGNDESFEMVFSRQLEAFGHTGDVLIAISTSGNSANVLRAAETARRLGLRIIGFTGATGGKLAPLCDVCVMVPSTSVQRIQECHIVVGHIVCGLVENTLSLTGTGEVRV